MNSQAHDILADRYRNKGTAFTAEERDGLGLHGLLPDVIETLDSQLDRIRTEYDSKKTDLDRHIFLRALQERNSVSFYAFVSRHIEELLPIIYTPTVGLSCEQWSKTYRRQHGLYISWPHRHRIPELLENMVGDNEIDIIVVTDSERILGLGDLGAGGMGIPIGKLALYTVAGSINPARTLPVVLDVGTNNEKLLSDPLYLGWKHRRVRGEDYDEFIALFIRALQDRFPQILLQWEDFAQSNATRLLDQYRDQLCSFNDDIQGTAVVTAAAISSGLRRAGVDFADLRLVIAGAGSAGTGIATEATRMLMAAGLDEREAQNRCWLVDKDGLLHDGLPGLQDFQRRFARSEEEARTFDAFGTENGVRLLDVIQRVAPHALVGVTGQPGLFGEDVIRALADQVDRPIVLPLSNPTARAEATPENILHWSEGRAQVGTGSPFEPVLFEGQHVRIAQVNNIYVFPGVGLGVLASGARRISDSMLTAAAFEIARLAADSQSEAPGLLPPITESRDVARALAKVIAKAAIAEGVADAMSDAELDDAILSTCWEPVYQTDPSLNRKR